MDATRWLGLVMLGMMGSAGLGAGALADQVLRDQAQKAFNERNYKDAFEGFQKLALDPKDEPAKVGPDLEMATQCLQQLNRVNEIDKFREAVIALHKNNWRLLRTAARNTMSVPHHGFMIAGEFHRGDHRGGGKVVNAIARDRIRGLQLMVQALPLAQKDENHAEVGDFLLELAGVLLNNRGHSEAWRLQYLSDLGVLPDFEDGWGYYQSAGGAPVDAEGNPVYHSAPKSFAGAKTDGERWRWCLEQTMEFNPNRADEVRLQFAGFLQNQFGVETMAHYGWRFGRMESDDDTRKDTSGTYDLHTLGEDETIARLATGVRRFKLPEEFNYLKVFQQVAQSKSPQATQALVQLAHAFENRRQYPKAADYWRKVIERDPSPHFKDRLDQITGAWGQFEPIMTQPAGKGATIDYRFRNGQSVALVAHKIKVPKLLEDVKAFLKSNPNRLDWERVNIGDIGYRLVHKNQKEYLGAEVASWKMDLKPRELHFDKRVTITTPLQEPGAYLLTATMAGGNTSYIVVWLNDTSIVKKPLDGKSYYYVADAVSGRPVDKANLEFFGWNQKHLGGQRFTVDVQQFAEFTDADGQLILGPDRQPTNYQWLITATTPAGRFAYLGFTGVWYGRQYDQEYNQTKVFAITDRPVYRPGQKVDFKFWVRHAQYDQDNTSDYANQNFTVELRDPKGEKILEKGVKADAYGGIEGQYALKDDATLGVYGLSVRQGDRGFGGGQFRVEEYKKPEFEVTVEAPKDPVMLGEKITATIKAKYYFGSPVTEAKVKYKVLRTSHTESWYPVGPWDWFYGPGYWWFAYDYDWYPGWREWGCRRPIPVWWPRWSHQQPEVVAEQEVKIGPDGVVKVEIDTGVAKAIHPDQDHKYSITAEVVDQSRRTIVGTGDVLVARKPFKVHSWVDRGYYRVGDPIGVNFSARRLDGKPVQGNGVLTILQVKYPKGKPVETPIRKWELNTNEEGHARLQIKASRSGQYRFSYELTDAQGHKIEGGYVFTIIGEGFDGADFRFANLELVPDKKDYQPGEKVNLQVNTDRVGGTVLLFVRPTNGVYQPPQVLRLEGKSTTKQLEVVKRDMPNFFVEAVTVADGRVYTETKEIVVPPEKRVLSVDVKPTKEAYKPGEKAKVEVKLTDFSGEPFVGSTVVAIYDKSLEYVSGGSNVPEIKEFFWKWRRHHNPQTETNLGHYFQNLVALKAKGMQFIGVFGATVAEEMDELGGADRDGRTGGLAEAKGQGGPGGGAHFRNRAMKTAAPMNGAMADAAMAEAKPAEEPMMAPPAPGRPGAAPAGGEAPVVQPTVRTKFADTALWVGALETKKDGTAEVSLDMPENLTTWRIKVWGMGHGTKVGQGQIDVVTRKDLILRMQAPRFFVQKDEVVLSANVHNYLKTAKSVKVALELDGKTLAPLADNLVQTSQIDPQKEARIDWRVKVTDEGQAVIRMKALTDEESDAMEMKFPCYVHGMLKMDSYSGAIRPKDAAGKFTVSVPAERRPEQSRLEVRYSPTLAGAMVDALPYLVDYPYGCTEQTLNRFLPTVITQKILLDMKLNLEEIKKKQTNLNAQEIGEDADRAKQWKRLDRNPVFDEEEVRKMVKDGVKKLTEMQLSDGGWGWFSGWGEYSSPHTTAYVVHGLQIAKQNDVALVPGMLERGVEWLKRYQDEQVRLIKNAAIKDKPAGLLWKPYADAMDAFVYMVLVDADVAHPDMLEFLYRDRTHLPVYCMAMYGIALEKQGQKDKLAMILRNVEQYLVEDNENQTCYLNLPGGYWWYWYGSEYEAHAYYLKLLSRTDPKGETAPRLVKYLLNNRKHSTYWNSTRDTALCIEAMADFLRASGEDRPEMTVEVWYDGKLQKAVEITPANLFSFDNKFVLEGAKVTEGKHEIELKKKGKGPLYYNGYLTNFTLEDMIAKAGLEVKVQRRYYKLEPVEAKIKAAGSRGQVLDQKVEKLQRKEIENLAVLTSGDLVEIELVIESKNDYEYLVFEDMKPAGFEPVDLRSGYNGNAIGAYMEFRDNRVVFFCRTLARGKHSVSYRMRAEIPGRFSALPTRAWAMYAPELKGNSDEIKLNVKD
jgi:uncharacterized protein YfaS (alpha-2-macroglobulin family)/tetratricopeptide (TPR) repeat protein